MDSRKRSMAARKDSSNNKHVRARIIFMVFVWVAYVLFTLSCLTFNPQDPPSHMARVYEQAPAYTGWAGHNWCGYIGACVSYLAMQKIGPGVYVAIVMLGIALFHWTRRKEITQL